MTAAANTYGSRTPTFVHPPDIFAPGWVGQADRALPRFWLSLMVEASLRWPFPGKKACHSGVSSFFSRCSYPFRAVNDNRSVCSRAAAGGVFLFCVVLPLERAGGLAAINR